MTHEQLSEAENFALMRWSMFGSGGYPLAKRGGKWWVDGMRGAGACPIGFRTKREASAQWESFLERLRDRLAGRE